MTNVTETSCHIPLLPALHNTTTTTTTSDRTRHCGLHCRHTPTQAGWYHYSHGSDPELNQVADPNSAPRRRTRFAAIRGAGIDSACPPSRLSGPLCQASPPRRFFASASHFSPVMASIECGATDALRSHPLSSFLFLRCEYVRIRTRSVVARARYCNLYVVSVPFDTLSTLNCKGSGLLHHPRSFLNLFLYRSSVPCPVSGCAGVVPKLDGRGLLVC